MVYDKSDRIREKRRKKNLVHKQYNVARRREKNAHQKKKISNDKMKQLNGRTSEIMVCEYFMCMCVCVQQIGFSS